jgi:GT2 family glycosyltransferase
MPAYNAAKYIRESIASVLAQTFSDFELIIVDDCSTDQTLGFLARYSDSRIRVVRNPVHLGLSRSRNEAFSHARGKYFAVLDSDVFSSPTRLAKQVAYLDTHPSIVLVATRVQELRGGYKTPIMGSRQHVCDPLLVEWRLHLYNILCHSSVMFRAEAARRLGVYVRDECNYSEDYDFYLRILAKGGIARLPEILTTYRVHSASVSSLYAEQQRLNAVRALEFQLTQWLGDEAKDAAGLTLRLFQGRNDSTTCEEFARLGGYLERLLTAYSSAKRLAPETHARIVEDSSRLWWEVASDLTRRGRTEALSIYWDRPKLARASWVERTLCRMASATPVRLMRAAARSLSDPILPETGDRAAVRAARR